MKAPMRRWPRWWIFLLVLVLTVLWGASGASVAPASAASHTARPVPPLGTVVIPNLGPGYAVTSQGPLDPSKFASDSPDPAAASGALTTLAGTISTYERVWQANGGLDQVQILLVRFPSGSGAQVFLQAARHALESGEIVATGTVPSLPGSRLVTYFAATNESGVGEAISMQSGIFVALLSFFSAAAGNKQPITPADATRVAQAQHEAMAAAPGGASPTTAPAAHRLSIGSVGWAVLAVAVLAAAVATPMWLRRRRELQQDSDREQRQPAGTEPAL
jgi:hypothetical protein